ncbi:glycerol-3-phosphate 1-O-acyltransferase PlsY [Bacillus sp. 03113]|uniref:glycerol-3-phosphate 1-O-acyltransferase PlsY n=1 Tax=Bacillus sp. 03113 TaxID=2578211 RepID=UPI0011447B6B|nr:glycerol-3-phosphate 1-O-acyltransferase PlsY [Bacillus sp. 03113]
MTAMILLASYLIGSFPTALLISKIIFKTDIRNHGSYNPGATNTLRVLGKRAAVAVLIIDIGKGALAAALPLIFYHDLDPLYAGLVAVLGHCFPIFAGFKGGKAIATTAGALLITNIWMFLAAYLSFVLIIYLSKYVFFGSLSVGIALIIYTVFEPGIKYELIFILFFVFLIYLHRSNLKNYQNKKEPKITDKTLVNDRIKLDP